MTNGLLKESLTKTFLSVKYNILFFFFSSFLLCSCENDIEKIKVITSQKKIPVESGKDIEILYSDSAILQVKIITPQLDRYISKDSYIELPKGLRVFFFDDSLRIESELTAGYAIRYERKKIMEARNNVEVINVKGERLNTEHLIWDEQKAKIYSNEFVKITTSSQIIYGNGFESNQNFTKYKIFKIKGIININKDV